MRHEMHRIAQIFKVAEIYSCEVLCENSLHQIQGEKCAAKILQCEHISVSERYHHIKTEHRSEVPDNVALPRPSPQATHALNLYV